MKRSLLPAGITLLFLALLFYLIGFEDILKTFKSTKPSDAALAFLLYTLSQVGRSLRWKLLLRGLSFKDIFLINSANIFFNNILPARTGELSWFYYAKRLGVELKVSLWSFLVGRIYDLLGMFSLLILSYSLVYRKELLLLSLTILPAFALLLPLSRELIPSFGKLKELKNFLRRETGSLLSLGLFLLSLLSFSLKALSVYVLVRRFLEIDPFLFSFSFSAGELTTILPVHSFFGYGTYEAGFVLPLKLSSVELKEALKAGFVAHTFLVVSSAVWGVLSIALLHTLSRKSP